MDKKSILESLFEQTGKKVGEATARVGAAAIAPPIAGKAIDLLGSLFKLISEERKERKKVGEEAKALGISKREYEIAKQQKEIREYEKKMGIERGEKIGKVIDKSTSAIKEAAESIEDLADATRAQPKEFGKQVRESQGKWKEIFKTGKTEEIRTGAIKTALGALGLAPLEEFFDISGVFTRFLEERKKVKKKAKEEEKEAALLRMDVGKYREKLEEKAERERAAKLIETKRELRIELTKIEKEIEAQREKEEEEYWEKRRKRVKGILPRTPKEKLLEEMPERELLPETVTMAGQRVATAELPREIQERIAEHKSVLTEVAENTKEVRKDVKEVKEILSEGVEHIEPIAPTLEEQKSSLKALEESSKKAEKETKEAKKDKTGGVLGAIFGNIARYVLLPAMAAILGAAIGKAIREWLFGKPKTKEEEQAERREQIKMEEERYGFAMPTKEEAEEAEWETKRKTMHEKALAAREKVERERKAKASAALEIKREEKKEPPIVEPSSLEPAEVPGFVGAKALTPEMKRKFTAAQERIYAKRGRPLAPKVIPEILPTVSPAALSPKPAETAKIPIVIPPPVSEPPRPAQRTAVIDDLGIAVGGQMIYW